MSRRQTMSPVPRVYVLPRCTVEVYETTDTKGVLGALAWTALQVDNLRISESFNEIERFSTGVPYPETHHTDERHSLTFEAVWNLSARLARNQEYIVGITWLDASLGTANRTWVRRFYQGVTTPSRDLSSREANEFGSGNTLKAKYYVETTGTGEPAATAPGEETC